MPFVVAPEDLGPDKPHLVVYTATTTDQDGNIVPEGLAVPVGARMAIVMDQHRADGVWPVFLAKVTHKGIWFRCNCGKRSCTRVLRYALSIEGHHPTE